MSLESTKKLLSRKYLGKVGIHGIGLSRAENAVRVHVSSGGAAPGFERSVVLEQLKSDAAPYGIIVTTDEAAVAGAD